MRKKSTRLGLTQSGFTSNYDVLFLFGYTNRWFNDYLPGYTHVGIVLISPEGGILLIEPLFEGPTTIFFHPRYLEPFYKLLDSDEYPAILHCTIRNDGKDRLIKPLLQNCTTLVQYLAGLSLRCLTPQGLYKCLTTKDGRWLRKKGILEVKKWEKKS